MKLIKFFWVIAALALIYTGCAKPPTAEMNSAIDAVTRAENDADAVLYAENSLARARDALGRMKAEVDSKRYDAAKTYAAEAITAAEKALADGKSGAARARDEAANLIASLGPAIAETETALRSAETAGLDIDFGALNSGFTAVRENAAQAQTALEGNRYQDALDRGRGAQAGLSDINQRLTTAVTSVSRKK